MMEDGFIVDLSPEANNKRFIVLAPEGGLHESVLILLENIRFEEETGTVLPNAIRHLDLEIRRDFTSARLRLYPGKNITQDPVRPNCFDVSDGFAVFLDQDGEEFGDPVNFGGELWTEATSEGSPTGELNIWRQSLSESPLFPFAS